MEKQRLGGGNGEHSHMGLHLLLKQRVTYLKISYTERSLGMFLLVRTLVFYGKGLTTGETVLL